MVREDHAGAGAEPLLVLSVGDPAGIGPEVLLKAAARWLAEGRRGRLAAAAPAGVLRRWADELGLDLPVVAAGPADGQAAALAALGWDPAAARPVEDAGWAAAPADQDLAGLARGCASAAGGRLAWRSLAAALDLVREAPHRRALVTAPASKEALGLAGFPWPGHTEYLGLRCGVPDPLMWMSGPLMSVGLVSNHDALAALPGALRAERVERKVRLAAAHVSRRHAGERLGVLAVNPHAGDGGRLGREEREWLSPLLERLRAEGLPVDGPLPADAALSRGRGRFLAMYHDQGLPAFKLAAGGEGVNTTLGLGLVRTSPGHGTAFDIAGAGRAGADSQVAALEEALRQLETPA